MIIIIVFTLILITLIISFYFRFNKRDNFIYTTPKILDISSEIIQIEEIPKKLMQTYISYDKVPKKVFNNIKKFAGNYEYSFFDHNTRYNFIKDNYDKSVLDAYNNLENLAHKSDLFRYCYLYINGGVYLDIKIELLKPLDLIFSDNYTYTALSIVRNTVCQGIISTPPKNKIFLDLIEYAKTLPKNIHYHTFTRDFYTKIKNDIGNDLTPGINIGKDMSYYLFQEKCTSNPKDCYDGLDNKGLCCFIYDNDIPIIKVRYSDYPW